jgi:hypothetical protein
MNFLICDLLTKDCPGKIFWEKINLFVKKQDKMNISPKLQLNVENQTSRLIHKELQPLS